jgi:ribosomal protein S18 acetylase RimI-like enzyme
MQEVKLVPATYKDTAAISQLAETIWYQYYPALISGEQIGYMLRLMYSNESLDEQIRVKGHQFFFIETDTTRVGFISVHRVENNDWFLNKFYIDQQLAAKGIGSAAFNELVNKIKPKKLTLTVNRQNYKSINFYFKSGFKIERVADFDIGGGFVMNDFVMVWEERRDNL